MLNAYSLFSLSCYSNPIYGFIFQTSSLENHTCGKVLGIESPSFRGWGGLAVLLTLWVSLTCDFLSFLML